MREMNLNIATPLDFELDDYSGGSDSSACLRVECDLAHAGARLDVVLAELIPEHSRSRLQLWIREGRVHVDAKVVSDPKQRLCGREKIELQAQASIPEQGFSPEKMLLEVVFEDQELLVLNKPAGLVVHPGNGNWSGTLLNGLLAYLPASAGLPRAGIVHRLDKDTSGLMVVAKSLEAQTNLVRQLQARTVKRHYHAFVLGKVPHNGLVDAPIGRHPSQRTKMAVVSGGREARTHYRVMERFASASWVECVLETGRTHQIRVHMAHIGHPLLGDPVYAGRRVQPLAAEGFERQALHAFRLGLLHPVSSKPMEWEVDMPDDMCRLLSSLRTPPDQ